MPEQFGDFVVVRRFFDAVVWQDGFLESQHVRRTWATYIYDQGVHVNCCELTPSYELHLVNYGYYYAEGFVPTDEEVEAINAAMNEAMDDASDMVIYIHCRNLDNLPEVLDNGLRVKYHHGSVDEDNEADAVEKLREYYCGNPLW